jgi:hypothetical protein
MDGEDGCTKMWVHLMPLNQTYNNGLNSKFGYTRKEGEREKGRKESVWHLC